MIFTSPSSLTSTLILLATLTSSSYAQQLFGDDDCVLDVPTFDRLPAGLQIGMYRLLIDLLAVHEGVGWETFKRL
jgi:hypothetical protein